MFCRYENTTPKPISMGFWTSHSRSGSEKLDPPDLNQNGLDPQHWTLSAEIMVKYVFYICECTGSGRKQQWLGSCLRSCYLLMGLSHEIFLAVSIHLGLNVNCFWLLNFDNIPSILDNYLKFWCVLGQTFFEILRILEKDWQLSLRLSKKVYLYYKHLGDMLT